ncbi:MAG: ABC transporter permease [Oscillospiraceae bacterium]|jgi:ABC-type dipeptide/oligopeptide/nickel transport system permease subunit|nr:ABC transporter permease [Oscillospiraceae bacterium]
MDSFELLEDELQPPVNEFRRFVKVFFKRKVVVFGFVMVVLLLLTALFADVIAPYGSNEQNLRNTLALPDGNHLLGTDALGRDLLSRIIYGTRVALSVGVYTVLVSAAIGTVIGLVAGYAEGALQTIIMRCTDAMMSIPSLILSLLIATILNRGVSGVVVAVAITLFPGYIRLINGQVLSLKQNDYILAGRSMGAGKSRMIIRHLLPNCLSPLIVQMTMMMGIAIMSEASLSFLGIGILPPTPAWGGMCYDGYKYLLLRPLLSLAPGFAIMLLVFAFNMVGDGLRDALDPKLRGTSSN